MPAAAVVGSHSFGWPALLENAGTLPLRSAVLHLLPKQEGAAIRMRGGDARTLVAATARSVVGDNNLIEDPGSDDVILGRGSANAWRPGNQRLHRLVDRHQHDYLTALNRKKKSKIIQTIYTDVRATGRFLIQGPKTGTFTDESEEKAKTKIGNMFRDRRRKAKELHSEDEALMTALGSLLPDASEIDDIKYNDCKSGTETLTERSEQMATDAVWPERQGASGAAGGSTQNRSTDSLDLRVDMQVMGALYQHNSELNEGGVNPLTTTSVGMPVAAGADLQGSSAPGVLEGVDLGGLFDGASIGQASPTRKGSSSSSGNSLFSDRALSSVLDRNS